MIVNADAKSNKEDRDMKDRQRNKSSVIKLGYVGTKKEGCQQ